MAEEITVTGDNVTLDLLLARNHGFKGQKLVEETLRINRGLAGLGVFIPAGTKVTLPDLPSKLSVTPEPTIDLFG